jgi:hypothetical protein
MYTERVTGSNSYNDNCSCIGKCTNVNSRLAHVIILYAGATSPFPAVIHLVQLAWV